MPQGAIVDGQIEKVSVVADVLRPIFKQLHKQKRFGRLPFGYFPCVTSIGHHLSVVKMFKLDGVDVRDIRRASRAALFKAAEFGKDAPLEDIDSCSVTAVPMGPRSEQFRVFKTLRKPLLALGSLFRDLGAWVKVENAALAMLRAYPEAEAILDVGSRRTALIVPVPDDVPDVTLFGYGADTLAERTSAGFAISETEARSRVHAEGSVDRSAAWSTENFSRSVALRIRRVRSERNLALSNAIMIGNGSRIKGLAAALAGEAGIGVQHAAIPALRTEGVPDRVFADLCPSIALAVGLALGGHEAVHGARIKPKPAAAPTIGAVRAEAQTA
jgi:hypothetical protein